MRSFFATLVSLALLMRPALADTSRVVDAGRSRASFSVMHAYVQRVTGDLPILAGELTLPNDSLVPIALEATLDPSRIKTGEDERDGELQGRDWFDVKAFPTWQYRSTRIVTDGPTRFIVEGQLTIHGVSAPVILHADIVRGASRIEYRATGQANRHAFGMHVTRTDALVGETVDISLRVVLK